MTSQIGMLKIDVIPKSRNMVKCDILAFESKQKGIFGGRHRAFDDSSIKTANTLRRTSQFTQSCVGDECN